VASPGSKGSARGCWCGTHLEAGSGSGEKWWWLDVKLEEDVEQLGMSVAQFEKRRRTFRVEPIAVIWLAYDWLESLYGKRKHHCRQFLATRRAETSVQQTLSLV
jgi:hypothetical protein